MAMANVLLYSGNSSIVRDVEAVISQLGGCYLTVSSSEQQVQELLTTSPVHLFVSHIEQSSDFELTSRALDIIRGYSIPVATLSIQAGDEWKSALLKAGVVECLQIPIETSRLRNSIEVLTGRQRFSDMARDSDSKADVVSVNDSKSGILFSTSGPSAELLEQIRRIAPSPTTVLLEGETGVGKTSMARLIHEASGRRNEPFITVNCGALSSSLVESELLGHVKGAFTGAHRDHQGKMEAAGAGTILLDDIDALPLGAQAILLRAIDERVFEPVGATRSIEFEARLVVATNRSLEAEVSEKRFREDLYYRINVLSFYLPPLRDRRELIQALAEKFMREFAAQEGRRAPRLGKDVIRRFLSHEWPGNVRELRNVVERIHSLCREEVATSKYLPSRLMSASQLLGCENRLTSKGQLIPVLNSGCRDDSLAEHNHHWTEGDCDASTWVREKQELERQMIERALTQANNNRSRAARALGISRVTLYKKLHKYHLMGDLR